MKNWENESVTIGFLGFGEMGSAIAGLTLLAKRRTPNR